MKNLIPYLIAVPIAVFSLNSSASLIQNGNFEDSNVSNWNVFNSINGWDTLEGAGIEIQTNSTLNFIDAQEGNNYVELDSHDRSNQGRHNSMMGQVLEGLTIGSSYDLSFWYTARTNRSDNSNGINMLWGSDYNSLTDMLSIENTVQDGIWHQYTYSLTATDSSMLLAFEADGKNDSYGGLIDNIEVNATSVPEPSILALMGIGVVGLGFANRRKSQS